MTDHFDGSWGGWKRTNGGAAYMTDLLDAAVPADAVYMHGAAYSQAGVRYVQLEAGAVPATAVFIDGMAHTQDGALYVRSTAPAQPHWHHYGFAVHPDGALYVKSTGTPVDYRGGIGVLDDGALLETGV